MVEEQMASSEPTTTAINGGEAHTYTTDLEADEEAGFRQKVARLLLCPVCHETVADPRQLDCGHFLCSGCAELIMVEQIIRCPKCEADVRVPEEGVRVDELVASLLALLAEFRPVPGKPKPATQPAPIPTLNGMSFADEDSQPGDVEEVDRVPTPAAAPEIQVENQEPPVEVIIQPPQDYQSPDENEDDEPTATEALVPATGRTPVEHSTAETEDKVANTDEPVEKEPEETAAPTDEADSRIKPSEVKPSDVAINIETERQCGDCHSNKCTCNVALLTPPVSNGSQMSVETNTSNNPSELGDVDIPVKALSKFAVSETASRVQMANRDRIYVTRGTFDDKGAVNTYDGNGKKTKFVRCEHHSYNGIAISKLGFIFTLNATKRRVEEYSGVDGKRVRMLKLDMCREPQAVDIMPTGEILVVDQEKHCVVIYTNSKKGSKPRILKNDLIKFPYDIAATTDGFYLTSSGSRSLLKMDLEGNVIWKYSGSSSEASSARILRGVCTDESGHVYVVDRDGECVLKFTEDGELKGRIRTRERTHKNQKPWYISVRDGMMAVLFSHNMVKTYQL